MNEHVDDDQHDVNVLRAADPGAGAHAPHDLHRRIAEIPDHDARQAPMHRRTWFAAAAAAVAIAAAGIGFALSPTNGTEVVALTRPAPDEIAPAVRLGGESTSDSREASVDPQVSGVQGLSLGFAYWGGWGGRQHFTVPAFDTSSAETTVYALDGSSSFVPETVSRAAQILGVPGDLVPNEYGGGWSVGDGWSGRPVVSLNSWGGSEIWFNSGLRDPVSECVEQTTDATPPPGMDWESIYQECRRTTPQPDPEQAGAWMGIVLDAFGIDEDDVTIEILDDEFKFENTLTVLASRVADGMATPISIHMIMSHEGIISAGGSLGDLLPLGGYRIVSPAAAAERLNTSAYSPDFAYDNWSASSMPTPDFEPPSEPAPLPAAGSPIPWSVTEHEIVSARLGLSTVRGIDGVVYVVPAYEFTDSSGNRWSVIALAEEELTLTPAR